MDLTQALLGREAGLGLSGRGAGRRPAPLWGGAASDCFVKKLGCTQVLDQAATSTAINDVAWCDSGAYLASAGDDCG